MESISTVVGLHIERMLSEKKIVCMQVEMREDNDSRVTHRNIQQPNCIRILSGSESNHFNMFYREELRQTLCFSKSACAVLKILIVGIAVLVSGFILWYTS